MRRTILTPPYRWAGRWLATLLLAMAFTPLMAQYTPAGDVKTEGGNPFSDPDEERNTIRWNEPDDPGERGNNVSPMDEQVKEVKKDIEEIAKSLSSLHRDDDEDKDNESGHVSFNDPGYYDSDDYYTPPAHDDYNYHDGHGVDQHAGPGGAVAVNTVSTLVSLGLGTTIGAAAAAAAGGAVGAAVPPPPPPPSPGTPPPPPSMPEVSTTPEPSQVPDPPYEPEPEEPYEPDAPEEDPYEPYEPEPEDDEEQEDNEDEEEQDDEEQEDNEDEEEQDDEEQEDNEDEEEQDDEEQEENEDEEEQDDEQDEPQESDEPKKPEVPKESDEPEEPEEPDPNRFVPKEHPELCGKFLTQQPDGDIVIKSPATDQDIHYYNYGDGTWFTDFTRNPDDPNQRYTQEEIEERLRYEAENKDYFEHIADKAAEAQQQQPDIQRKEDEKFYDEYHKWKKECEESEHHQDVLNRVALRRGIADSSDEKAIRRDITKERVGIETRQAKQDLKSAALKDMVASVGLVPFDAVDKTCETAIFALAGANPDNLEAKAVQDAYIFLRSTGQAGVEAFFYMKEGGLTHVALGAKKGVDAVLFQSHAKDLAKLTGTGVPGEAAMFIGSEGINSTLSAMEQGKDPSQAALGSMKVKAIAYGLGKIPVIGSGGSKGLINGYFFVTDTVPDAWGALKRFKQAYED